MKLGRDMCGKTLTQPSAETEGKTPITGLEARLNTLSD